jgi:hypothetical protein
LALLLPAPCEAGTVLVARLHGPGLRDVRQRVAQLAHATPLPDGGFLAGGALLDALPPEVLRVLTAAV